MMNVFIFLSRFVKKYMKQVVGKKERCFRFLVVFKDMAALE